MIDFGSVFPNMSFWRRFGGSAFALSITASWTVFSHSPPLSAAPPAAGELLFPPAEICSAGEDPALKSVDPLRLIRWLIAVSDISDAAFDANRDGDTLLAEKQLVLVQPDYCTTGVRNSCTAEDAETLQRVQDQLGKFADQAGGQDYVFERIRRPTIEEMTEAPFLNPFFAVPGRQFQVAEILDIEERYVRIYCTSPEGDDPSVIADADRPEIAETPEKPDWIFNPRNADGLRLTSEIDDLNKDRNRLGSVRPAELSITSDLDDDQTLYQVKAVVGYNFEIERSDLFFTSTIPFLQFERFFNGSANEVDKIGVGVQEAFTVREADHSGSELAITPLYLTDSDLLTQIGLVKFRLTPTLAPDAILPIGFPRAYGPLSVQLEADALADIGRVFDDGGNSDLENEAQFFRLGGRFGVKFRSAQKNWFENIELDVSTRYLANLDGNVKDLYRLDVSIAYLFTEAENYRLSVSYANGLTDDTLEETEYWKTQFGIRF